MKEKREKVRKQKLLRCLLVVMFLALGGMCSVRARAEVIREADVSTASPGCTMLGIEGSFLTDTEEALKYINQIRYEACKEGYKDPRNTSRNLTLNDYIPIKWSQALEMIARMRAAEASMSMYHNRLNGKDITSIKYGGISLQGECLAWHGGDDVLYGITQWYDEKKYWITSESGVTGHYEALINPDYQYIGLGNFYCEETHYNSTLAGIFHRSCGSLGSVPLDPERNIIQKIEVKNDYLQMLIDCEDVIGKGMEEQLIPKAMVSYPNGYETKVDVLFDSYTYASSDPSVADISSNGTLHGKKEGTTTITIFSGGEKIAEKKVEIGCPHHYEYTLNGFNYSKKCSLCGDTGDYESFQYHVFGSASATSSFSLFNVQSWAVGDEYYVWPAYRTSDNSSRIAKKVYVESTNENVLSFTKNGYDNIYRMNFNNPGIAQLKITPKEDPGLASTYTIRVQGEKALDLQTVDVQMPKETYLCDGKEKKPIPVLSYDNVSLENGKDYTISYQDNIEAGIASVILTGKGIFSGTKIVTFTIEKSLMDKTVIQLSSTSYIYTGKAIEPEVQVTLDGTSLKKGQDYTISYENNVDVGTGKVLIKGMGEYKGEVTKTFSITPIDVSQTKIQASCESTFYNGREQSPKVTVSGAVHSLKEGEDYTIDRMNVTNAGSYKVSVRFIKNYSGTLTTTWVIKKTKAEFSKMAVSMDNLSYTGKPQKLITAAESGDGNILYALKESDAYKESVPTAIIAGAYQVFYKIAGDQNHFDSDIATVSVSIDKATPQYSIPKELSAECNKKLYDVVLGEGFSWEREDTDLLNIMDHSKSQAVSYVTYTPKDVDNYKTISNLSFTISIKHSLTCIPDGKGNHSEKCSVCEYEADQIPCHGGEATCSSKAVCELCHSEYGGFNENHIYQNGVCLMCGKEKDVPEQTIPEQTIPEQTIPEQTIPNQNIPNQVLPEGAEIKSSTARYVISDSKKKEVELMTLTNTKIKGKTLVVPNEITHQGVTYKVTAIRDNAWKGQSNITKIVIGKNITYVGKKLFRGYKKLKMIVIKSKKLTSKSVSPKAFSNIKKTTKIVVPKSKLAAYKKLLRKKGLSKKVKVKNKF